eukprot:Amastigsp_a339499_113.p3 type:complete len:154 gc:universal Amastigsp_a339499_113:493-32(-)
MLQLRAAAACRARLTACVVAQRGGNNKWDDMYHSGWLTRTRKENRKKRQRELLDRQTLVAAQREEARARSELHNVAMTQRREDEAAVLRAVWRGMLTPAQMTRNAKRLESMYARQATTAWVRAATGSDRAALSPTPTAVPHGAAKAAAAAAKQ